MLKNNKKLILCSILVFSFFFISHFFMDFSIGDDLYFYDKYTEGTIPFLISRYEGWSSRLIIECVLINILHLPKMIFFVTNSSIFVLIYYSILKITSTEDNLKMMILLMVMIVTFPIKWFASAGWYATMLNYAWPLAFGLYSLYLASEISIGEKLTVFQKIVYLPVVLFGSNQEQLCALLFGFIFLLNIYVFYRDKKLNKILSMTWLIITVMLCIHAFCPGNAIRLDDEVRNIYPEFKYFSMIGKLILGVLSTFSTILSKPILVSVFLLLSLCICAFRKKEKKILIIMCVTLALFLLISMITFLVSQNILNISIVFLSKIVYLILEYTWNVGSVESILVWWIYFVGMLFFVLLILIAMYKIVDTDKALFVGIVFIASLMSRFILGLSPSNFTSLTRTSINMYFFQMVCIVSMLSNTKPLFLNGKNCN